MDRLTKGEKIVGIGALVLLIASFLSWAKVEFEGIAGVGGGSESFSAWSDAYGAYLKLGLITALLALILVGIRAAGTNMTMPLSTGMLYLIFSGITALTVLIATLMGPDDAGADAIPGIEVSRGLFMFVGLLAALAMAYGAWMHYQGEQSGATATMGGPTPPMTPPPPAS